MLLLLLMLLKLATLELTPVTRGSGGRVWTRETLGKTQRQARGKLEISCQACYFFVSSARQAITLQLMLRLVPCVRPCRQGLLFGSRLAHRRGLPAVVCCAHGFGEEGQQRRAQSGPSGGNSIRKASLSDALTKSLAGAATEASRHCPATQEGVMQTVACVLGVELMTLRRRCERACRATRKDKEHSAWLRHIGGDLACSG